MPEKTGVPSRKFPPVLYACGFSIWKKPIVKRFFSGSEVKFVRNAARVPSQSMLMVWGRKPIVGKLNSGVQLVQLEDGFIRSVGLGAELVRPLSWVIDTRGIYYDATQPSDLEVLLQTREFSAELSNRAALLGNRIVSAGITKYNVGRNTWQRPAGIERVLLVPGQVESDASLKFGAPGINTNHGLLQAVRAANPDAYVLYKPHPDVVAGLRRKGANEHMIADCCNEVVDGDMGLLLRQVDEVHTLTSLTGFEALLRGKKVTCYGQPFYSGWGLTNDVIPSPRRTRCLSLEELIAGCLILYPTYLCGKTGGISTPERALEDLMEWRGKNSDEYSWLRMVKRWMLGRMAA